jgi:hypothetical protein
LVVGYHAVSMVDLAAGSRWKSAVSDTEVIVVRPAEGDHRLGCGGADMVAIDADGGGQRLDPDLAEPTLLGKRYTDETSGLEVLCTKGGDGVLTLDGAPLVVKGAKPLPSSD